MAALLPATQACSHLEGDEAAPETIASSNEDLFWFTHGCLVSVLDPAADPAEGTRCLEAFAGAEQAGVAPGLVTRGDSLWGELGLAAEASPREVVEVITSRPTEALRFLVAASTQATTAPSDALALAASAQQGYLASDSTPAEPVATPASIKDGSGRSAGQPPRRTIGPIVAGAVILKILLVWIGTALVAADAFGLVRLANECAEFDGCCSWHDTLGNLALYVLWITTFDFVADQLGEEWLDTTEQLSTDCKDGLEACGPVREECKGEVGPIFG